MEIIWPIIIAVHLCSLLFLTIYLKRLFRYAGKYRMPESKYTLLFGWVQLSYIAFAYIGAVCLFVAASLILINFLQ